MFPLFDINGFLIYTFWITITICFFSFTWMLEKLSDRFWYSFLFFKKNILWYFLSVFIFSRLFYVIWNWADLKYIKNPFEFFIMSEYNFSLVWAIVWFLLIFYFSLKIKKEKIDTYIDWLTISLLFILFIGFIWTLFWWQVYWRETFFWIEITYDHPFTPVPYQVPIFPLPIVYSILFFILFSWAYISSLYVHIKWLIWYVWLTLFGSMILIFDFFSWKDDIFKDLIFINMSQTFSLILIWFCSYRLYLIYTYYWKKDQNIIQ